MLLLTLPLLTGTLAVEAAGTPPTIKGRIYMNYDGAPFYLSGVYLRREDDAQKVLYKTDSNGEYRMAPPTDNPTCAGTMIGGNCRTVYQGKTYNGSSGPSCHLNPHRWTAFFPNGYNEFPAGGDFKNGHWELSLGDMEGEEPEWLPTDPYWIEGDWFFANITNANVFSGFDFRWVPDQKVTVSGRVTDTAGSGLKDVPINPSSLTTASYPFSEDNLALNRPAQASSVRYGWWDLVATRAVDGNLSSLWISGSSDPNWISIDLGTKYKVDKIVLKWADNNEVMGATFATEYDLQVSNDNSNWSTISSRTGGTGGTENLEVSGEGQFVRVWGKKRSLSDWNHGYALEEIEVYGEPADSGTNLALHHQTRASSESLKECCGNGSEKVTDGDGGTRWRSGPAILNRKYQWIYVDLGVSYSISKVVLKWHGSNYGEDYKILVSDDAVRWKEIFSRTNFEGGWDTITDLSGVGRYVRMQGVSPKMYPNGCLNNQDVCSGTTPPANCCVSGEYSLYEFEIYGNTIQECFLGETKTNGNGDFSYQNVPSERYFCLRVPASVEAEGVTYDEPNPPSYECQIAGGKFDPDGCNSNPGVDLLSDNQYNFVYHAPEVTVTFTGQVWLDNDQDKEKDSNEDCYNGNLILSAGGVTTSPPYLSRSACDNSYSLEVSAAPGTVIILTLGVPGGYKSIGWQEVAGSPPRGSGSSFTFTVVANGAKSIDFGIKKYDAWFQVQEGDFWTVGNLSPTIDSSSEKFMFPEDGGVALVAGQLEIPLHSAPKWSVATYSNNQPRLDFDYYQKLLSIIPSSTLDQNPNQAPSVDGVYIRDGDLTIGSNWTVGGNKKIVILVKENLNITRGITVEVGSSLTFVIKKNVSIEGNVTSVEGIYLVDGMFETAASNKNFVGSGVFVAWGDPGGTGFDLNRDLGDNSVPAELFRYRTDQLINASDFLKQSLYSWQETSQ